jgi:ribose transport system ATP-binding protein
MELIAESLVKHHPGVLALDDVSVAFASGEIHAVVGENGAGKSSLMNILSGASVPDSGSLTLDGTAVRFASPHAAHAHGIRMIHQEMSLVPELTVAENISLGAEPSRGGVIDRARQQRHARDVLDRLGQTDVDVNAPVGILPLATQQMIEIAKAVSRQVRLLILDEPTAILSHREADVLFAILGQLRAEGVAIAYISHRMDEVFRLSDRITVLRDGRVVSSAGIAVCTRSDIVRQMVGRVLADEFAVAGVAPGVEVLRLTGVRSALARDVTLNLRRGEVVALVGLVGAGRTAVVRAVFGAARLESGTMACNGVPYHPTSPRDAIAAGVALLPEDRKGQGLVLMGTMRDNTTLASLDRWSRRGVVDRAAEHAAVARWIDELGIRAASQEQVVSSLSGGNQQKVVLARWMLANSSILLFDEPTRGVDVGAKAEIYDLMRRLTDGGTAILMISSDLPEALGLADRIVVMRDGRTVGELARGEANPDVVAALILGESRAA